MDILFTTPWMLRSLLRDGADIPAKRMVLAQGQTMQLEDLLQE